MAKKEKKPAASTAAKEKKNPAQPTPEQPVDTGKRLPKTSSISFQGHDQRL